MRHLDLHCWVLKLQHYERGKTQKSDSHERKKILGFSLQNVTLNAILDHSNLPALTPERKCYHVSLAGSYSHITDLESGSRLVYSTTGIRMYSTTTSGATQTCMETNYYSFDTATQSDEVHFWLNGYVNKQNCRIWSEANPQVYVETPLHPEKLTVWCASWAGGIIGPYFFKNDEGHNVTVNGDRYRAMITNFFIPELNNHDVQELWFQQDGASCHTAHATIDLLKDTFGDRLISRFGPVNWPPRSCDLTPLDYFLWGYVKSLVYVDMPQTLDDHLEDNIRRVIADIRPQMLEKVIENWTSRLDYIRASRGSPMPEIIFKM
ncbi:putative DD41D transposase [Trichonephila clavipes]|nr:putative DD41D transposase [Trichonephila clavipes]